MVFLYLAEVERKVLRVGERAFGGHTTATRSTMYEKGITVSIEGESEVPTTEEKKAVPWLQNQLSSPTPAPVCFPSFFRGTRLMPYKFEYVFSPSEEHFV